MSRTVILTKKEAIEKLKPLIGRDLRELAEHYDVTVFKNGKPNKGWAGHVLECYLGLGLDSTQAPNGGFWELKVIPFIEKNGDYKPKETMAITMINADDVARTDFENSHLWSKLKSLVLCGRLFVNKQETSSKLLSVDSIDLGEDDELIEAIKKDYNLARDTIVNEGFNYLTGKMGVYVQPRTKGPGHGSTSRAFYARTGFIKKILNL